MAEYIDREKAMAIIRHAERDYVSALIEIRWLQADDVVPVVRCQDCKYYEAGDDGLPYCSHTDGGISDYPRPNDFCSYGERKA